MAQPPPYGSCSLLASSAQHSLSSNSHAVVLRWQTFTMHIAPAIPETLSNKCAFLFLFAMSICMVCTNNQVT